MHTLSSVEAIMRASFFYTELFRKTALHNISGVKMTKTEFDVLIALETEGSLRMSYLSDRLVIAREQVTRTVNALKERGLVESKRCEDNRKNVVASLTLRGKKLLKEHKEISITFIEGYLDTLTPQDRKTLISNSRSVADIFRRNSFSGSTDSC